MISFSQILILFCFVFLLFGDFRSIANKVIVLFVNLKTLFTKDSKKEETNSENLPKKK